MVTVRPLAGWVALTLFVASSAEARPLTMRAAERAIDLAFHAEIAGDVAGGRAELERILAEAADPSDLAPRQRITAWLERSDARRAAFAKHGKTADGYAAAFRTLDGFGAERAELLWSRAVRDVPGLKDEQLAVTVVTDRLAGMKQETGVAERLAKRVEAHGVIVRANQPIIARLDFDATETKKVGRRMRVVCKSSFVLRDKRKEASLVGSSSKRRTETRRKVDDARRFAVRRALDDAAEGLVFYVRLAALERRASQVPTATEL